MISRFWLKTYFEVKQPSPPPKKKQTKQNNIGIITPEHVTSLDVRLNAVIRASSWQSLKQKRVAKVGL